MPVLKIEQLGAEVLRRRAEEVPGPDAELDRLIDDMFETMYDARGIGLAAPQVGVSRRVIVVDVNEPDTAGPFALLNPRVVEAGERLEKGEEGCLSIPGVSAMVERPSTVVVEGLDRAGNPVRIEAVAMLARCLQHEIDHLDGVLFVDRISPLKRKMLLARWKKQAAAP
ncbi:MAG TPA: peptide deformylase [Longimicrobiaceae bacterium]|nr:peptide deformylase [Longimicrobiaceae bacterium]